MTSTPRWFVRLELALPAIRPHDHHPRLTQALADNPVVISGDTSIIGQPGRFRVAASLTVAAADATTAGRLARQALQRACSAARLPTGQLTSINVERA